MWTPARFAAQLEFFRILRPFEFFPIPMHKVFAYCFEDNLTESESLHALIIKKINKQTTPLIASTPEKIIKKYVLEQITWVDWIGWPEEKKHETKLT